MVALGDDLRADDDADLAVADIIQRRFHFFVRGGRVARQDACARLGKISVTSSMMRSTPEAAGSKGRSFAAFRACGRNFRVEPAMVAMELAGFTVFDQPRGATRTFEAVTAGTAQGQWRVAPAVEEQEHLSLFAFDGFTHDLYQSRRDKTAVSPVLQAPREVDDVHIGHFRAAVTIG